MREIKYLSPTAILDWRASREEFYKKRLADNRLPRMPQTNAMAVGSAFDAYVKASLGGLDFEKLFEAQVEEPLRDEARIAGKRCLDAYIECGAYADLQLILHDAQFELCVETDIVNSNVGVPLLGKPDAFFKTKDGGSCILDWKVNGYYSKAYPKKGYVIERPSGRSHKDALVMIVDGVPINFAATMNICNEEWAMQTCIYSWIMGAPVGSDILVAIDQLFWNTDKTDTRIMSVAEHRSYIDAWYQHKLHAEIVEIWDIIQSGHIFRDMSEKDSHARQHALDSAVVSSDMMACLR